MLVDKTLLNILNSPKHSELMIQIRSEGLYGFSVREVKKKSHIIIIPSRPA